MTNESVSPANLRAPGQHDLPQPLALLLFTQRLAALMEAHISMPRILAILQDAPAPYGAVAEHLKKQIEEGNALCEAMSPQEREEQRDTWWHPRSLARAMSQHPEQFSPVYITLVRVGENAGAVDETLRGMQKTMAREWRLLQDGPEEEGRMFLNRSANLPWPQDWQSLSVYQQMVTLALFFETFGMLLISGVALLRAMDIISDLLPKNASAEFMQVRKEIQEGAPLLALPIERLDFIPRHAKEIAGTRPDEGMPG